MSLTDFLLDFSTISVLLLLAFLIRRKISFLQKYFIPTSLIAGILGLLLGPQVLGQVSPVCIQFSDSISQWVNFFFAFIFATSFLGSKSTKFGRNVISATCVTGAVFMAQVVVGLALAYGFSMVMDNVPYAMGLLPVSAFYGGHGSAGIMGGAFATEGWSEATSIGMTYATVGMFAAVFGGMILINIGAKRGITLHKMDSNYLEEKDKTGILPQNERKPMATAITNTSVLDPFAFQIMIVGAVILVSHLLRELLIFLLPFWERIPLYTMCLLVGAVIGLALSRTKYNQYIDRGCMQRISGTALEYVIASAVATIQISVLATYLVPILVTSVVICILTAVMCLYLSKKWYGEYWFEMAMGSYGQCTGSLATGLLLIRVLDPNGDSQTAESVSGSSTLGSFFQQPYNVIGPMLMMSAPMVVTLGSTGFLVAFLVIGFLLFGRSGKKKG